MLFGLVGGMHLRIPNCRIDWNHWASPSLAPLLLLCRCWVTRLLCLGLRRPRPPLDGHWKRSCLFCCEIPFWSWKTVEDVGRHIASHLEMWSRSAEANILAQTAGVPSIPWSGDGLQADLGPDGTIPEEMQHDWGCPSPNHKTHSGKLTCYVDPVWLYRLNDLIVSIWTDSSLHVENCFPRNCRTSSARVL